ncbi:MAG: hypothetical protein AAGG08_10730 [Actinomycetota bacterium]
MRPRERSIIRSITTVAVVLGTLAACGGSDDATEPASDPGTDTEAANEAATDADDATTDASTTGADEAAGSETDVTAEPDAAGDGSDAAVEPAADDTPDDAVETAPEVETGQVVIGGEAFDLSGPSRTTAILDPDLDESGDFDFDICETVNPAFAGDFNIVGTLGDGTPFRLSGNLDRPFDDFDGLFFGPTFEEEAATDAVVMLDGRTLSGTATSSRGPVEFTFTC